jgi:hypothetical protein
MRRRTFVQHSAASLVGLGGWQHAHAQGPAQNPPLPSATVSAELPGALWCGSARMRVFGFNVYDATLWVTPEFKASRYGESPFVLELAYLRALNGRAVAQRSTVEMRRAADYPAAKEASWQNAMEATFPDVKDGDRLTGLHSPKTGASFWFNGAARPSIADADFSRLFFGIWLSTSTSEPKLRSALLARATA